MRPRLLCAALAALVPLLLVGRPAVAQPREWVPSSGDVARSIGDAASPVLPAILLVSANVALMSANIVGIVKRPREVGRYVPIILGYLLGALELTVGALHAARIGDDSFDANQQREAKIVAGMALGMAAGNVALALWHHLLPRRPDVERRRRISFGTGTVVDAAGKTHTTLVLGARF